MKRDDVIKRVADIVGPKHSVDLKNFDLLILVEIYRVSRILTYFSSVMSAKKGLADSG